MLIGLQTIEHKNTGRQFYKIPETFKRCKTYTISQCQQWKQPQPEFM